MQTYRCDLMVVPGVRAICSDFEYMWTPGVCPPQFFNPVNKTVPCENPVLGLFTFSSVAAD